MIIILFGLSGAGKTYIGNVVAEHFDYVHVDADEWLTEEMKQYIKIKKSFTLETLEEFTQIIIKNVEALKRSHTRLVISQGLYRNKNREDIKKHFADLEILFIQVNATKDIITERLKQRGDWISPNYASQIEQFFEPMENAYIIENNSTDDAIITQLKEILT